MILRQLGSRRPTSVHYHFRRCFTTVCDSATRQFHQPAAALDALVTCLPGLEPILSSELRCMGILHHSLPHGAKLTQASIADIFRSNLYLGSASTILLRCGKSFSAKGLAELRRKTAKLAWGKVLANNNNVRLQARVTASKSKLYHSEAIESRVIAGVYEALGYDIPDDRTTVEYPSSISEDAPMVKLEVQIVRDHVDIWLNASTTPLHRRGYRLQTGKAPLREDLAYSMLYAAGWIPAWENKTRQEESSLTRSSNAMLFDPLCGSGTIAIEGAAMLASLPPGRLRPPPLQGTQFQNNLLHEELLADAQQSSPFTNLVGATTASPPPLVFASDRDAGAVSATRANAERAGVLSYMDIQCTAVSAHPLWSTVDEGHDIADPLGIPQMLVATNPPFGKRVSKAAASPTTINTRENTKQLLPLYQSLWNLTTSRPNTDAVLLTHRKDLMKMAGWKVKELFRSTHGGLSVWVVGTQASAFSSPANIDKPELGIF